LLLIFIVADPYQTRLAEPNKKMHLLTKAPKRLAQSGKRFHPQPSWSKQKN